MAHSKTQSPTGFYCFHIPPPLCASSAISFWLASQSTSRPPSPSATLPCCKCFGGYLLPITSIMNEICFHCKEWIHGAAGSRPLTRQSTMVSLPSACVITLSWNWGCHICNSITVHFHWDDQNHQQNPDEDGWWPSEKRHAKLHCCQISWSSILQLCRFFMFSIHIITFMKNENRCSC